MVQFFQLLQIIIGIVLIMLILVHSPKGDGMASIGGAANLFSSQKGVEAGLNKITGLCFLVFIFIAMLLGFKLSGIPLFAVGGICAGIGAYIYTR